MTLTARQPEDLLTQFEREGYCIQQAFAPAECEALIEAAKSLEGFTKGDFKPAMMPHNQHALFMRAIKNRNVVAMMEKLVGGKVAGLQTEFFYCKPGTRGFSMHQDNFFVQAPTGQFASAWIALTDTYKEKGGLIAFPGSHKEGELPVRKLNVKQRDEGQDPNANNEETDLPPGYRPLHATVKKGEAFYIHGHLVHASNPNVTDKWRYVLLMTYARQGAPFRPGKYAQRTAIDVYN